MAASSLVKPRVYNGCPHAARIANAKHKPSLDGSVANNHLEKSGGVLVFLPVAKIIRNYSNLKRTEL